jgi:hypothetical protein
MEAGAEVSPDRGFERTRQDSLFRVTAAPLGKATLTSWGATAWLAVTDRVWQVPVPRSTDASQLARRVVDAEAALCGSNGGSVAPTRYALPLCGESRPGSAAGGLARAPQGREPAGATTQTHSRSELVRSGLAARSRHDYGRQKVASGGS